MSVTNNTRIQNPGIKEATIRNISTVRRMPLLGDYW